MRNSADVLAKAMEHHRAGDLSKAESLYKKILAAEPNNVGALHLVGVIAHQRGRHDRALQLITRALTLRPDHFDALYNLGDAFRALGRLDEAIASYDKALALRPSWPEALNNRGNALKAVGRLDEAAADFKNALALRPGYTAAINNLGTVMERRGLLAEAVDLYGQALSLGPPSADVHTNLGNSLVELSRLDEAVRNYDAAIALRPDCVEAHAGLASAYRVMGNLTQAMACCETALALQPGSVMAINTLGIIHKMVGRFDTAMDYFDRAAALDPNTADARVNRALALFCLGRLKEGWVDYEWRWRGYKRFKVRPFSQPWWDGQPLEGKTLLVWGEQGIGDQMAGIGMLPDVMERAGHCVVECEPRLVDLFARSFPSATVVPLRTPPHPRTQDAEYQIPLFGLARHLREDLAAFPRHAGGFLKPEPGRADHWRTWLDGLGPGLKVGLIWKTRIVKNNDADSFPSLDKLRTVLDVPGLVFVNLQYDESADDIAAIRARFGVEIHSPPGMDLTNALDDVAALTAGLDAVVGPITSPLLLAGALGRPAWMFTYFPVFAEMGRFNVDHMPWCPSVKVETCGFGEDWTGALTRVAERLRALACAPT